MSEDPFDNPRMRQTPASTRDDSLLETWRARLDDVPDLRLAKVMRVRRAIATNSYDEQATLDKALPTIQEDLEPIGAADPFDLF